MGEHPMSAHAKEFPLEDLFSCSDEAWVNYLLSSSFMIKRVVWKLDPAEFKHIYTRIFYAHNDLEHSWTEEKDPLEGRGLKLGNIYLTSLVSELPEFQVNPFNLREPADVYLLETGRLAVTQTFGKSYDAGKSTSAYGEYGSVDETNALIFTCYEKNERILRQHCREIMEMIIKKLGLHYTEAYREYTALPTTIMGKLHQRHGLPRVEIEDFEPSVRAASLHLFPTSLGTKSALYINDDFCEVAYGSLSEIRANYICFPKKSLEELVDSLLKSSSHESSSSTYGKHHIRYRHRYEDTIDFVEYSKISDVHIDLSLKLVEDQPVLSVQHRPLGKLHPDSIPRSDYIEHIEKILFRDIS